MVPDRVQAPLIHATIIITITKKNNEGRIEEHGLFRHIYMIGTNFLLSEMNSTFNIQ